MVVQRKVFTVDEFWRLAELPENQERCLELINGEIVEKMPTYLHGVIIALLTSVLFIYLRQNPIGHVAVEARFRVPGSHAHDVIPDLALIFHEKGEVVSEGAAPYMPDLGAEVQDEDQSDKFMLDRGKYYLTNGSRMVWLIYTEQQIVEILTSDARFFLGIEDIISGGDVLPGFSLPIRELFAE